MGWYGPQGDCGCCEGVDPPVNCYVIQDDFTRADAATLGDQWDETAGTWAIDANNAETSSSNARAIAVAELASGALPSHLTALMSGAYGGIVIFDYVDASNYHYIERRSGGSFGGLWFYKVTGGTADFIGSNSLVSGDYISGVLSLTACISGDQIVLNLGSNRRNIRHPTTLHGGTKGGIGTVSVSGTVVFESFSFGSLKSVDSPTCPFCVSDCISDLCEPAAAYEYAIEFPDPGFLSNAFCDTCGDIGGTYILRHRGPFSSNPCSWSYTEPGGCQFRWTGCCTSGCNTTIRTLLTIESMGPGYRWRLFFAQGINVVNPDCDAAVDILTSIYASETFMEQINCPTIEDMVLTNISQTVTACTGSLPATILLSAV